jgi:hypothetical protein
MQKLSENLTGRHHFEDVITDGRIILKCIFEKVWGRYLDSTCSEKGLVNTVMNHPVP